MQGIGPPVGCNWRSFVFPKDASEHVQEEVGGRKQPTLGLMEPLDHLNHGLLKKILFLTVRNL